MPNSRFSILDHAPTTATIGDRVVTTMAVPARRIRPRWIAAAALLAVLTLVALHAGRTFGRAKDLSTPDNPSGFTNFETEPVRPLALSPDGMRLYALNTADDRLEIYANDASGPVRLGEVSVGLRPVAVAVRAADEVWVVNHLSDSVSVVDVANPAAPRVVRTLRVGDEPRDIVVAGPEHNRVFVATARRADLTTPGVGRADLWIFDAKSPDASPVVVTLFGMKPRGLAVTADGSTVYAAVFRSGNGTTTIDERTVRTRLDVAPTATPPGVPAPGRRVGSGSRERTDRTMRERTGLGSLNLALPLQQPTAAATEEPIPPPPVSRIAKSVARGKWLDDAGHDWQADVPYSLPDQDVFVIDAAAATPKVVGTVSEVGTILFNLAVQPATGELWVTNTEAHNVERFEPTLRSRAVDNRITRLVPRPDGTFQVLPATLNRELGLPPGPDPGAERARSLSQPTDIVFSADGAHAYVAVFGSAKVAVLDRDGLVVDRIPVGFGPGGLALDEAHGRLFVLNHLDATVSAVDLATKATRTIPLAYDPTPPEVRAGRPFLYDAARSSGHGDQSCASCHVFGDLDGLAWDLGDPNGKVVRMPFDLTHENFILKPRDFRFHPQKGPMTTQTLRGLHGVGPMHWRGDRFTPEDQPPTEMGNFKQFQPAFHDLLGRPVTISDAEMEAFGRFVFTIRYPPNPNENLDRSQTPDQKAGADFFSGDFLVDSGIINCAGCHTLPLGTDGLINFEGDRSGQDFKAPQLRALYEKVGRFQKAGPQVSGFGFSHDGSTDSVFELISSELFTFPGDTDSGKEPTMRRKVEAYLLAFDTGMAPAVGQQLTVSGAAAGTAAGLVPADRTRLATLQARATAGDCDLVARARMGAVEVAWLWSTPSFAPDSLTAAQLSLDGLLGAAKQAGSPLTFTCVPPGDGRRSALDRDLDGALNGDERAAGSDPANPASYPGHIPTATATPGIETPGPGTPGAGTPGVGTPGAGTPGAGTPGAGTPGSGTPGAEPSATPGPGSTPGTGAPPAVRIFLPVSYPG